MKKLLVIAVSVFVALGLGLGTALSADAPKDPVKVTNFGGAKGVVTYDHAKHKDLKCVSCHHNEKDGKYKCGECHKKELDKATKAASLKDAAHGEPKGVCYSCHKAEKAKNKLACDKCHAKK
jgi:hypothetical protein